MTEQAKTTAGVDDNDKGQPKAAPKQAFYFKCLENPKAPLLVLNTYWEAEEMKRHPSYVRVDADGNEIRDTEREQAENRIPFTGGARPTLGLPKKK